MGAILGVLMSPEKFNTLPDTMQGTQAKGVSAPLYHGTVDVELTGLAMMRQRREIQIAHPVPLSKLVQEAIDTAGSHTWDYQGMQDETIEVSVSSDPKDQQ